MTVLDRPIVRSRRASGVVGEIAARRAADVAAALDGLTSRELTRQATAAPAPRGFAETLARGGLHLIAELKRASPSAGSIAAGDDIAARARGYAAGGAAAVSVLCERHWFGGSPEDVTQVRAATTVPVLAKEFVVDRRQLPFLRSRGADAVLLLAVLHPPRRLASLVDEALDLGIEPLVEAHDARELDVALGTRARVVGLNNRDLRTLDVDLERAAILRDAIPRDRIAVAESGVRGPATVRAWRALDFDAALVGETLMRARDPSAAAAELAATGRPPADPANVDRRAMVKICGVTDEEGALAAVRSGADAIGLNLVPGTPRALSIGEAAALARLVRAASAEGRRPAVVAVTADASVVRIEEIVAAVDADVVQLSGDEPSELVATLAATGRPVWKAVHVVTGDAAAAVAGRVRRHLDAGAERILLDVGGGTFPGGTGRSVDVDVAAAVARELPVVLAGGLDSGTVAS
ncbi:MAG TPA: hypothetical protein VFI28_03720, partial [Candidatus Limnocylindrales bacterium]|nr:hypothetical protein [Candidatus Limnocylindrales bacterium]